MDFLSRLSNVQLFFLNHPHFWEEILLRFFLLEIASILFEIFLSFIISWNMVAAKQTIKSQQLSNRSGFCL